jgi:hypothetical protein
MAVTPAPGRDPSQREQILASQSLLPTEYMAPNYLVYGNAPGFGDNGMVGLYPGKQYTLYDNRANKVLASGSTPEEIQGILDIINTQLVPQGNKADWRLLDMGGAPTGRTLDMFTTLPSGFGEAIKVGDQYGIPIAGDVPNSFLKEYILPTAGILAATGGAYFGGNALLGAAGGGGAGGAGAISAGAGAGGAGSGLVPGALSGLSFAPVASVPVAASTVAPIVVTAGAGGLTAAQLAALAGTTAAGTAATTTGGAASSTTASPTTPAATTPAATTTTAAATGSELAPLIVTAGSTPTNLVPASLLVGGGAAAAAAANAAGSTTNAADLANSRTGMTDAELAATNAGAGGTSFLDKIISNMGVMDYATLASLAASAVAGGGGGGGAGSTTPYVSPFGAGTDFAGLASRRQINPNITDYEKYGFGPEAQFFSGIQTVNSYTPPAAPASAAATNLVDSAAQATLPQSAPLTLNEGAAPTNAPTTQIGGNLGPSTPENTGMTQERLDQLQARYNNMRSPEFFNYFKSVNDVLDTYVGRGYMTPDQAKAYQGRLETAASAPNANLTSLQGAVPMPQISDFLQPTGTPAPVTYTAPSQPITDRSAYINDLYKQLGANVSQGLLAVPQAQTLQGQLRQAYLNPQSTTEQLQGIYNTGMQQYKPLI